MAVNKMDRWHGSAALRPRRIIDARSRIFNHISDSIKNLGGFIHEWTPFLLVMSYFVFSTCLYMFCTDNLISIFWFIYLTTNFYIAGSTVLEALMSLGPTRDAWKAAELVQKKDWTFPTPDDDLLLLDLLIVAYLPNEQDIIMDRVHYALDEIRYPKDRIRVNLVYNTPHPIEPLESSLQDLALRKSHFCVFKVPGSKSKADNLNYFFSLKTDSDVITIFDADHYTHPYGPRWAVERFISDKNVSIVQGRCVIFNTKVSWLASMIAVEFDKIYAISHPGRASLFGFALFTGSNGYWRTPLLQDLKMDGTVLTEDIDSSMRALSRGCKIVHDLNVVSYELAPTSIPAMWKQRLRWAQGWTQISMAHLALVWKRSSQGQRNLTMRFGLLSLLLIREFSYYLVTQYCCLVLSIVLTQFPKTPATLARFIFFPFPVSVWFFIISIICLIATLWITARVRSEFITRWMVIMFSIIYTPYLVFNATMGIYGHARQVVRYTKWNPTKRT
ncbi:hypothetical protein ACLMJK_005593 [Lecanora helva]